MPHTGYRRRSFRSREVPSPRPRAIASVVSAFAHTYRIALDIALLERATTTLFIIFRTAPSSAFILYTGASSWRSRTQTRREGTPETELRTGERAEPGKEKTGTALTREHPFGPAQPPTRYTRPLPLPLLETATSRLLRRETHTSLFSRFLPANGRITRVEARGFKPPTSAMQSQGIAFQRFPELT